jgi:4-diphosphocytidyl-2-C-methyl-D-erythritol kinase
MLDKQLPIASGIGGGSADAAATLRVLKQLWNLSIDPVTLRTLAAELGADVPVCLASTPTRMSGIGDRLEPAPALPPFGFALINPGVPVSTVDIFKARAATFSQPAELPPAWASARVMAQDLSELSNDLETVAIRQCPVIEDVLSVLREHKSCLLARMSGSGATCFGIFADEPAARAAVSDLKQTGWWCWSGLSPGGQV